MNLTPFDVGLKPLANADDQDPAKIYDAAAKVAAELSGAKLGFIGCRKEKATEIKYQ